MSDEILKKTSHEEREVIKQVLEKARQQKSMERGQPLPMPSYSMGVVPNKPSYVVAKKKPSLFNSVSVNPKKEGETGLKVKDLAKVKILKSHLTFLKYRHGYYTISFKIPKFALNTNPTNKGRRGLIRV